MLATWKNSCDSLIVDIDLDKYGGRAPVLLQSDTHSDSRKALRKLEIDHLDYALEKSATILRFGDTFDAMQGSKDRRGRKSDLLPELQPSGSDDYEYFDKLVNYHAERLGPYAPNIAIEAEGNHETAIKAHNETNLTRRLVDELNAFWDGNVVCGPYEGWILFRLKWHKTKRQTIKLFYTHGSGGSAPVTRGAIQTNRRQDYIHGADIIVSGHIHNTWWIPRPRQRVTNQGRVHVDNCHHISLGGYKRRGSWEVEKGFSPEQPGAMMLWFTPGVGSRKDTIAIKPEPLLY